MRKYWMIGGGVVGALLLVLLLLWASARKGDIPYATLEKHYATAQSRFVDLPGGFHVHYRDQGNPKGPTVLLVHGFFVSLETWEPWVQRLGKDYRLVSVDLPGHGLTRAPQGYTVSMGKLVAFVDAFANAEHLDRFTLVGSSMGGDIAWRYALAHPDKLKGLVLVDSAGWPEPPSPAAKKLDAMRNPVNRFLFKDFDQSATARAGLKSAYADPKFATDAMLTRDIEFGRAPGHRDIILDLLLGYASRGNATSGKLAQISTPTLVMVGAKDQLVPPADGSRFASAIPGSRLVVYPNSGHIPQEEAADASAADLAAFLASLEPKKGAVVVKASLSGIQKHDPNTTIFY